MDDTFMLTIEKAEVNIWPFVGVPVLIFCVGLFALIAALVIAIFALIERRRVSRKEQSPARVISTATGIAGATFMAIGFFWYDHAYTTDVQTAWQMQITHQQEIALTHRGFSDVHVTSLLGADDHIYYSFSATRSTQPVRGILTPTHEDNTYEVIVYPAS